jgi:hypothetical protein
MPQLLVTRQSMSRPLTSLYQTRLDRYSTVNLVFWVYWGRNKLPVLVSADCRCILWDQFGAQTATKRSDSRKPYRTIIADGVHVHPMAVNLAY